MYAFGGKIAQALLVALYLLVAVWASVFNALHHRQALHHAPAHAVAFDIFTQVAYLFAAPYFAQRHVVKCGHDALHAYLF